MTDTAICNQTAPAFKWSGLKPEAFRTMAKINGKVIVEDELLAVKMRTLSQIVSLAKNMFNSKAMEASKKV